MSSDRLQGGFYGFVGPGTIVLGLVTKIKRLSCLTMSLTMSIGRIQGDFCVRVGPLTSDKGFTVVCLSVKTV